MPRLVSLLPAILVGAAVVGTPLLALAEPVRGSEVAAIFPPGWQEADVLQAAATADAALLRFGAFANIGILRLSGDDIQTALRDAGALILLPPGALGGCFDTPRQNLAAIDGIES